MKIDVLLTRIELHTHTRTHTQQTHTYVKVKGQSVYWARKLSDIALKTRLNKLLEGRDSAFMFLAKRHSVWSWLEAVKHDLNSSSAT